jgi:hypothetical protein
MSGTHEDIARGDVRGGFDPREAAQLLETTTLQARRAFDPESSPLVAVVAAALFLFGYGAAWWSLRDQKPEVPALWSLAVLYGLVALVAIVGSLVYSRATVGISVSAQARRQRAARGLAIGGAAVGAWVVQGALRHLGVSDEIVYGVFGPTVPLIAIAGATAGIEAMREHWLQLGTCLGLIVVASVSTFFGPAGAWGLTGGGCCAVFLVYAVALVSRQRRA